MSSGQRGGRGRGGGGSDRGRGGGGGDRGRGGFGGDRGGGGGGRGRGGGPPGVGQTADIPSRGGPSRGGGGGGSFRGGAGRGQPPGGGAGGIFDRDAPVPPPDKTITEAENKLLALTRGQMIDGFPGRRSYGTNGRSITLRTNYFRIKTKFDSTDKSILDKTLYKYDVDTGPNQLNKAKRRRLVEYLLQNPIFSNTNWATDYANIIVTTDELPLPENGQWVDTIILPPVNATSAQTTQQSPPSATAPTATSTDPAATSTDPTDPSTEPPASPNQVTFRVVRGNSFSLQEVIDYLRSTTTGHSYPGQIDMIQILNIVTCKPPQADQNVACVGQNNFYPFEGHPRCESFDIGGSLQALRGFFVSVRPTVNRLLVNVNVTSGAFYQPINLVDLLQRSGYTPNDSQAETFIKLLKVWVVYKKDKGSEPPVKMLRTIVGFASTASGQRLNANQVSFDLNKSGAPPERITVNQYFAQEKGITLQKPTSAVINVGTRARPEYLPMELCTVVAGQPYKKILGPNQTSDMIRFAARSPNLNAASIAGTAAGQGNGLGLFGLATADQQQASVKMFGFAVDPQMLTVPGRILSPPRVSYGAGKSVTPQKGSWNFLGQKFAIGGRHGDWQVWTISHPGSPALKTNYQDLLQPEELFDKLAGELKAYGVNMGKRLPTLNLQLNHLTDGNRPQNDAKLVEAIQGAQKAGVKMIFIVLQKADRWLYARIKYHCDLKFGIHTINAIGDKLQKNNGQGMFMGNLALKFNVKGGGAAHLIQGLFKPPLDNNTMLVGIDVTHPSPGSATDAPSISAIVASIDQNLAQWPGSIRTQEARKEMVDGLDQMVLERLAVWRKKNGGKLPTKIIIYRDGVSEGQYGLVLEREIPPFRAAFKTAYGESPKAWPKIAVFVVGKRHHTRFYPTSEADADYNPAKGTGSWNPLPGTVVDRGIVGRDLHEMYLQAHQGLQGTARPAHYVPILDEIGFEADVLENFTHSLCYLFNRASKAVSYCPPAYYADLLCERGRCYRFQQLAENNATQTSAAAAAAAGGAAAGAAAAATLWTSGVHPNLQESTWYI